MKRQGAGRVLHFAVTGALLGGGAGVGCASKDPGPTNTMRMPDPELHANPGPNEDPGAAEGGAPEPDHVNEGPVDEPEGEPPTMNVVKQPEPKPTPTVKHVNVAKEPTPKPEPKPDHVDVNPGPQ